MDYKNQPDCNEMALKAKTNDYDLMLFMNHARTCKRCAEVLLVMFTEPEPVIAPKETARFYVIPIAAGGQPEDSPIIWRSGHTTVYKLEIALADSENTYVFRLYSETPLGKSSLVLFSGTRRIASFEVQNPAASEAYFRYHGKLELDGELIFKVYRSDTA